MTAYHGLQDPSHNRLLRQSEQSQLPATNGQLETAAPSQAVAEQWIQLSNNSHYILVSTCDGPASTICRQNAQGNSFETWRPLHLRYSTPLGTRSIGYLTRLLKPKLDEQKFEESFTTWEFQLAKDEQDNHTPLPDAVTVAILLNETKGPLQQHLQLQAGYYRAASSSNRLQAITSGNSSNRGPAPMDIGATWYNNSKGNKGKRKGKGKYNKGKGYGGYGNNYSYNNYKGGKGKYNQQPVGQGNPFKGKEYSNKGKGKGHQDNNDMAKEKDTATREKAKDTRTRRIWQRKRIQQQRTRQRIQGQQGYGKGKGYSNKGKGKGYYNNQPGGKGAKGKQSTNACYRCGQPGHMAKQCRVAIYNCDTGNFDINDQTDDWYSQAHYDSNWYHQDQTQMQQQQAKTSDKPWTGWTNFGRLESDDEEQQQGTRAKAAQAPKQPTPQYRSWCPTCVQARGRTIAPSNTASFQSHSLALATARALMTATILTAIDIQSGMIMAIQLTNKRMLFDYAVTQLQHFLIECGRTSHTILQPDQETSCDQCWQTRMATSPQGTQGHTVHNHREE